MTLEASMEYDEKTCSYKYSAADITSDDIVNWLENHPVAAFEGFWFQLTPNAQEIVKQVREDGREMKVWEVLRYIRLAHDPGPSEASIAEFEKAQERNELSKEHIGGVAVISFLKNTRFDDLIATFEDMFKAYGGKFEEQFSMSAWDVFSWLMANLMNNSRFESEAKSHEHLAPQGVQ